MALKKICSIFVITLSLFTSSANADSCVTYYDNHNYAMALSQCQKEAQNHSTQARFVLGQLYENGYGVSQNLNKAISYYRLAVLQNDVDAQIALGKHHARLKNHLYSHIFFSLANENGSMRARSYKVKAEQNLTTQELAISQDFLDVVKNAISQQQQLNHLDPQYVMY